MINIEYAYRRFCTERFPLPTQAQLQALEQRIRIEFPEDYRNFVLRFNGGYFNEPDIVPTTAGCPEDALEYLCGIGASHDTSELGNEHYLNLFDDNDPPQVVPIGSTSLGGLILLDTAPGDERGMIYLKVAFGSSYFLADGIDEFFGLLHSSAE